MATTGSAADGQQRPSDATVAEQPPHPPGAPGAPKDLESTSWYRRGWVIGLIALLVGAGVGVAVGVTAGSNTTTRVKSSTVTAQAQTVVRTVTRAVRASAPAQPQGSAASGGGGQTFRGNSYQNLGTVNVPSDSVLSWQCPSCTSMEITSDPNSDGNDISVSSQSTSGESAADPTSGQAAVAAGTYKSVQVNADGK